MNYPDHLDPIEAIIIETVLHRAVNAGYRVRVHDGETFRNPEPTEDLKLIRPEVAATEATNLFLYTPKASTHSTVQGNSERGGFDHYVGRLLLIHGNDEDVLSDISTSTELMPTFEAIFDMDRILLTPEADMNTTKNGCATGARPCPENPGGRYGKQ